MKVKSTLNWLFLMLFCISLVVIPASTRAQAQSQGNWWEVAPEPYEAPLSDNGILYSQIAPKLHEIEMTSNRVKVEVIGQSAGGRNLFLVTLSDPKALGRLGQYQAIRETMLKDPEKAQEMIDQFGDFKVPFFINASIHGGEVTGVDAAMRLIEKLAYDDSEETRLILDNIILLINVVQNPDGRVMGTRGNANGFDVNRDFITQSQPESQATVKVITEWNPMVLLDLHGFSNPMLIEPCTPPHNPNYEYDLYIKWAFDEALAMETELMAQTGFPAQIPFRDRREGWDDWPPIFTPMYAMYHGAYGHTLETPYRDERGVDAHYAAAWGALNFAAQNRVGMVHDQIEIFRRGFLSLPQLLIPQEILDLVPYDQYNNLTTIEFPAAYVIPQKAPLQQNPHEVAHIVNFLLANDVQVDQAVQPFTLAGISYPIGTYVVWMNQPKRGLANAILWAGWDISYEPGLRMYDISGWSHPLLWGFSRLEAKDELVAKTVPVQHANLVQGSREPGKAVAYAYLPTSNQAVLATNDLLKQGVSVYRTETAFFDKDRLFGVGTYIVPGDAVLGELLAQQYGLQVFAMQNIPSSTIQMHRQKIAVYASEGVTFFLKQYGFDYKTVNTMDLKAGVLTNEGYDVFINSNRSYSGLSVEAKDSLASFMEAGGDYIGIGRTGSQFAVDAGLLVATVNYGSRDWNGIIKTAYVPTDPISAQYPADSYAFVYGPAWFTNVGAGVQVSASIQEGDFFVSGFWADWKTSGAGGQPVVIHQMNDASEVTLMGIDPTFRAHPEFTFQLLANAIYSGMP